MSFPDATYIVCQDITSTLGRAWGDRSSTFAIYLFLVEVFPNTLIPASLFGFCTTAAGILFSGTVGAAIDKHPRMKVLRNAIIAQKTSAVIAYAIFLAFFLTSLGRGTSFKGKAAALFTGLVICGTIMKVSTVCLNISIERDWTSVISRGSSHRLTKLNGWLRRVVCDPDSANIDVPLNPNRT